MTREAAACRRLPAAAFVLVWAILAEPVPSSGETVPSYAGTTDREFLAALPGDATPIEIAGAEIWTKATAGNARFHTYVYQQRLHVLIDWYRVLRSRHRAQRFKVWGLINDPSCCTPGSRGCPAGSLDETYGFDWCPGDGDLLGFVGRPGFRDPACDSPYLDPDGRGDRQDPCDLEFGTSTGALGLRKFPNPRFDLDDWTRVNGGDLSTWDGFRERLADPSIEPPFLIGMACSTCHVAFDPLTPPDDPANPSWQDLSLTIGNQYTRISEIMASGMSKHSLEWQLFGHARPGTVDTSAVPNDQVNNPGTMNAFINFDKRPAHEDQRVVKWRKVGACPESPGTKPSAGTCWCEPGKAGKCWEKSEKIETVHGIIKGGEDSTGIHEAVQRVYVNIGSCSESCWVNHLTDLAQVDPHQRGFGQTPFDVGQCRRDCPNFRAVEDRLDHVVRFLLSARPADLYAARRLADRAAWVRQLEAEYGKGAVERGRQVFARECAPCHSSQEPPFEDKDFLAVDEDGRRIDWLGSERATKVSKLGTYPCRALHSNHKKGHVWEQFGSESLRQRPGDPALTYGRSEGGTGYMRPISLINTWAHAPFLHNNAVGPEICGKPSDPAKDFYASPYVDADGLPLANAPDCWEYDPSVEGRYQLYKASMECLLHPDRRLPKVTLRNEPIVLELGPRRPAESGARKLHGLRIELPPGKSTGFLVSLRHKELVADLVLSRIRPDELERKMSERFGDDGGRKIAATVRGLAEKLLQSLDEPYQVFGAEADALIEVYCNCTAAVENAGHRFGAGLSEDDKTALTAFVATL